MIKRCILGFLALIISALNILNATSIDVAKADNINTEKHYSSFAQDHSGYYLHTISPSDLQKFKNIDGSAYRNKTAWQNNSYITNRNIQFYNFFVPFMQDYYQINSAKIKIHWKKDKPLGSARLKVWNTTGFQYQDYYLDTSAPNNTYQTQVIDISNFINTAHKLNHLKIDFQAQKNSYNPINGTQCETGVYTDIDLLELEIDYDNLIPEGGIINEAPESSMLSLINDYDYSPNTDKVAAIWQEFDSPSPILEYKSALGTSAGLSNVCSFTSTGLNNQIEFTNTNCSGINLTETTKYYFTVKGFTHFGPDVFTEVYSDGITIDTTDPLVNINSPLNEEYLNKTFNIDATASDIGGSGMAEVKFQLTNTSLECKDADGNNQACPYYFASDNNGSDGWTADYNSLKIPDGKYNLKTTAFDNIGNTGQDNIYINIDNTPPTNPTLNVEASPTQARVYWNPIPDAVSYNLFKDGVLIAENITLTSYTDKNVIPGQTYNYKVTAKDNLGNENTGSDINATIPEPGEIITSSSSRLASILGDNNTPLPEDEDIQDQGEILGTNVDKTDNENKDDSEKNNYSGWIYLLLLYILIILGYYYYYLKDEYTPWFWIFPLIVGLILLFINNSLTKVLEASNMAKLFWLWELIVFTIFVIYYQFFGRPIDESEILKKYKVKPKKK